MAGKVKNLLTGKVINGWIVGNYVSNKGVISYNCVCDECGAEKSIRGYYLNNGSTSKCSHKERKETDQTIRNNKASNSKLVNIKGEIFDTLEVKKYLGDKLWLCRCNVCNSEKSIRGHALRNGSYTKCNHGINKKQANIAGKQFDNWTVIEYIKDKSKWKCRCSCGEIRLLTSYQLTNGLSKSCGHNTTGVKSLTGMKFGEWEVLRKSPVQIDGYSGGVFWECRCSCGTVMDIGSYILRNGISKSCGCKSHELRKQTNLGKYGVNHSSQIGTNRTLEQLDMIDSREKLANIITNAFKYKPTTTELGNILGLDRTTTLNHVRKYELEDLMDIGQLNVSRYEKELARLFPCENTSNRKLLNGKEVDLYYPESKLAVEFNGNYWHSDLKKHMRYHQEKTLEAAKNGVQLIHIFEYEWNNELTKDKIIKLIDRKLNKDNLSVIYARNCIVKEIDAQKANMFIDEYHLQGKTNAKINIGIYKEKDLLGVMTLDRPRFNSEYEYELIRLAWKSDIVVVGGANKMFKYFINKYNPISIITYCDISKFTGNIYTKLGFKVDKITDPNYKWIGIDTNEVKSRYQTTKQKLLSDGLGKYGETESDIMQNLGFLKVYDSGNLRLTWSREGEI